MTVIVSDQHQHNTVTGAFSAAPSTSAELKEQTAVVLVVVPAATATSIDDAFSHHLCSGKLPLLWGEQETLNGIGRRQSTSQLVYPFTTFTAAFVSSAGHPGGDDGCCEGTQMVA